MRTQRTVVLVGALLVAGMALSGCSAGAVTDENDAPVTKPEVSETPAAGGNAGTKADAASVTPRGADLATTVFNTSWWEAVEIAQTRFAGGLTDLELDWDDSRYAYKVELVSDSEEYEVRVAADTGEVFDEEIDQIDADDAAEKRSEIIDLSAIISVEDALAAAVAVRGGAVEDWKLDNDDDGPEYNDDDGPEYDVDIADGSGSDVDVTIDAVTGAVRELDD